MRPSGPLWLDAQSGEAQGSGAPPGWGGRLGRPGRLSAGFSLTSLGQLASFPAAGILESLPAGLSGCALSLRGHVGCPRFHLPSTPSCGSPSDTGPVHSPLLTRPGPLCLLCAGSALPTACPALSAPARIGSNGTFLRRVAPTTYLNLQSTPLHPQGPHSVLYCPLACVTFRHSITSPYTLWLWPAFLSLYWKLLKNKDF